MTNPKLTEIVSRMREVVRDAGHPWGTLVRTWADELERLSDEPSVCQCIQLAPRLDKYCGGCGGLIPVASTTIAGGTVDVCGHQIPMDQPCWYCVRPASKSTTVPTCERHGYAGTCPVCVAESRSPVKEAR